MISRQGVNDYRSLGSFKKGTYKTEDIEVVETFGKDSDFKIVMKDGTERWFRCSCAITFEKGFLIIN